MNVYVPASRTFLAAEIATCSLHNILTPRGAKVRDAHAWAGFLNEAVNLVWRPQRYHRVEPLLATLRAGRSQRLAVGAARQLPLSARPDGADDEQGHDPGRNCRGAESPARHRQPVVQQGLLRHLQPQFEGYLPILSRLVRRGSGEPQPASARGARGKVGGGDGRRGQSCWPRRKRRWRRAIIAGRRICSTAWFLPIPKNAEGRALLADSYEQQGYQAESAIWRNMFLSAARDCAKA